MVNKRVPEWLNSLMWSSPATGSSPQPKSRSQSSPSHEDRIANHTSKSFKVTSVNASVNETRESPPSPGVIRTKSPSESVTEAPNTRTKVMIACQSVELDLLGMMVEGGVGSGADEDWRW
ncbi:hypothetical protein QVD17_19903 [Tagetes erecta]|uniref:Uncharacterized protein n=1 Tax=Tagetes erecta TaxID=13708 RepID=A0AAD8KRS5_TARER|nr:hypothetical protein QVD17_19903 [Tagetes erecta]